MRVVAESLSDLSIGVFSLYRNIVEETERQFIENPYGLRRPDGWMITVVAGRRIDLFGG